MKRYRLLKDLPTFKAGDEFFISEKGNLIAGTPEKPKKVLIGDGDFIVPVEVDLMAYAKETLQQFPNILEEWFEEIKSFEVPDEFEMGFWTISHNTEYGFCSWYLPSVELKEHYEEMLKHHMEIGWAFSTKEEAEKYLEWFKARAVLIEDTKGFKPDWGNWAEQKWYVEYDYEDFDFNITIDTLRNAGKIYFATRKEAENSIKTHEKEWKTYLGVE